MTAEEKRLIMGSKNLLGNNSNVKLLIKYAKYFQKQQRIDKNPNAAPTVNKCEHREYLSLPSKLGFDFLIPCLQVSDSPFLKDMFCEGCLCKIKARSKYFSI